MHVKPGNQCGKNKYRKSAANYNFFWQMGQINNVISVAGAVIFKFHATQATDKNSLANRGILRNDISSLFPTFTIALAKVFVVSNRRHHMACIHARMHFSEWLFIIR